MAKNKFISIPGIDGEVDYMKRDPKLAIRVVSGPLASDYVKALKEWPGVEDMSTAEFVDKVISPMLSKEKPRLHEHLPSDVAYLASRKEVTPSKKNLKKGQSNSRVDQILGFEPSFFQKSGVYGEYDHDYNFISHVWSTPVKYLIGYMGSTILSNWADIFSVSQLAGDEQAADLRNITEAVYGASEMKILVDPQGIIFTRIWCLFEMVSRIRAGKEKSQLKFITPALYFEMGVSKFDELNAEQRREYWRASAKILEGVVERGIDCMKAEATVQEDRDRILSWIQKDYGIKKFNEDVTKSVRDEIKRLRMVAGPIERDPNRALALAQIVSKKAV